MQKAKYWILGGLGLAVLIACVVFIGQIRAYKTQLILAKIEQGSMNVKQEKAVAALKDKHKAEIAAQEAKLAEIRRINAEAQTAISAIKVKGKEEVAALKASSATWEVKFNTLEGDYGLLLDKNGKLQGLVEGLKLEIGGIEEEVFTLKQQAVETDTLYESQKAAWKKQLAVVIRKASRSFGIVAGPVAMFGTDGKVHYGAGISVGWRLY